MNSNKNFTKTEPTDFCIKRSCLKYKCYESVSSADIALFIEIFSHYLLACKKLPMM